MVIGMDYPVIDPVGTGSNIRNLIRNSGNSIADVGRMLGIADMSTMYKWLRHRQHAGTQHASGGFHQRYSGDEVSHRSGPWCKRKAQGSPKPRISDHTRTDLFIALWCNGNTPDSCHACRQKVQWTFWSQTLELQVSSGGLGASAVANPVRAVLWVISITAEQRTLTP